MNRRGWTLVLLGTFLAVGPGATADDTAAPHGLGLLVGRGAEPAAQERLKAALSDPRPTVRAAAVRVIVEAGVAPSGCVHSVAVLRGIGAGLDVEAMRAVSGWGYGPTLVYGQPVPIVMTVTVNFKLH